MIPLCSPHSLFALALALAVPVVGVVGVVLVSMAVSTVEATLFFTRMQVCIPVFVRVTVVTVVTAVVLLPLVWPRAPGSS
eukprot:m.213662 g.213662  ORF g.213662 m.213662 type:complete len:80 (-) comp18610_c0_seq4:388-627(-)